jgi:hypothetical protein
LDAHLLPHRLGQWQVFGLAIVRPCQISPSGALGHALSADRS